MGTMQVVEGGAETKGSCDQIYNELEADLVAKLITTLISVSVTLCVLFTEPEVHN